MGTWFDSSAINVADITLAKTHPSMLLQRGQKVLVYCKHRRLLLQDPLMTLQSVIFSQCGSAVLSTSFIYCDVYLTFLLKNSCLCVNKTLDRVAKTETLSEISVKLYSLSNTHKISNIVCNMILHR